MGSEPTFAATHAVDGGAQEADVLTTHERPIPAVRNRRHICRAAFAFQTQRDSTDNGSKFAPEASSLACIIALPGNLSQLTSREITAQLDNYSHGKPRLFSIMNHPKSTQGIRRQIKSSAV